MFHCVRVCMHKYLSGMSEKREYSCACMCSLLCRVCTVRVGALCCCAVDGQNFNNKKKLLSTLNADGNGISKRKHIFAILIKGGVGGKGKQEKTQSTSKRFGSMAGFGLAEANRVNGRTCKISDKHRQ